MGGNKNFVEGKTYGGEFPCCGAGINNFSAGGWRRRRIPPSPPVGKTLCEVVWVCPKCFLFIIIFSIFFSTHFAISLFCLHNLKTMEQQRHHACNQWNQNKSKRPFTFKLTMHSCNSIIKGWLHCLTSDSKGRFLVYNVLLGSAWCLVMAQTQLS